MAIGVDRSEVFVSSLVGVICEMIPSLLEVKGVCTMDDGRRRRGPRRIGARRARARRGAPGGVLGKTGGEFPKVGES